MHPIITHYQRLLHAPRINIYDWLDNDRAFTLGKVLGIESINGDPIDGADIFLSAMEWNHPLFQAYTKYLHQYYLSRMTGERHLSLVA